jgi:hypothetical protein
VFQNKRTLIICRVVFRFFEVSRTLGEEKGAGLERPLAPLEGTACLSAFRLQILRNQNKFSNTVGTISNDLHFKEVYSSDRWSKCRAVA